MNPELENKVATEVAIKKHPVFEVTILSKYLALALFIIMPFVGGWVGYHLSPVEMIQMETGNNHEVATNSTIFNDTTFPLGKTVKLKKSIGGFTDLEKPIIAFLI